MGLVNHGSVVTEYRNPGNNKELEKLAGEEVTRLQKRSLGSALRNTQGSQKVKYLHVRIAGLFCVGRGVYRAPVLLSSRSHIE